VQHQRVIALGLAAAWAATGHAAPASSDCSAIDDSAARLACYDRAAGRTGSTASAPAQTRPAAPPPAPLPSAAPAPAAPAASDYDTLKRRADFDSRIVAVTPLRHGYSRIELEDGTAYETTIVAAPPPVGVAVHVSRTFLGTTQLTIDGRGPIVVRLSRRQR
jgi:hypothetical protein